MTLYVHLLVLLFDLNVDVLGNQYKMKKCAVIDIALCTHFAPKVASTIIHGYNHDCITLLLKGQAQAATCTISTIHEFIVISHLIRYAIGQLRE